MVDRAHRWQVLFGGAGGVADEWDDLEQDARLLLVEEAFGLVGPQGVTQAALLTQLLAGDPPLVWETFERLLGEGLDPHRALAQLRMVLLATVRARIDAEDDGDDQYERRLARLPLPGAAQVEDVLDRLAAEARIIPTDDLTSSAVAELGGGPEDDLLTTLVERVLEELIEGFGPLQWLSEDRTVHRRAFTEGIVLTHELTEWERASDRLEVDVDLAGFVGVEEPVLAGGDDLVLAGDGRWSRSWLGPEGWLEAHPAGTILAVRVDGEGTVALDVLDDRPAVDPEVVELVRRVVEAEVDEPEMPVTAGDVVLAMLVEAPAVFAAPQAPLRQLCEAAGLEVRGTEVGDDPQLWRNAAQLRLYGRLDRRTDGDRALASSAAGVLEVCDQLALEEDVDPAEVGAAVASLADLDVLDLVSEELFRADADPMPTPEVFAGLIRAATGRSSAAVRTLAAIAAERAGDALGAEQHLALAVEADPTHPIAVDRLAWCASDRGDAVTATRLWSELAGPSVEQALEELQPFTRPRRSLGRNEPCWCGSGRKHKHCHLGEPERAPLADRVGWLCRKAVQYLERRGPETWDTTYDIAMALVDDDPDRVGDVVDHPVVVDLALTEGGWFEAFLAERGPLLPEDEALLAASWLTVDRTVYEVAEVDAGRSMVLRDLRSGELVDVRERTFSTQARPGMLVCARAVPDGASNQLVGAVLSVPVGQEPEVLDLLDDGDPVAIAAWVASCSRPPQLRNREGELLVQCELVVEAGDLDALVRHLDRTYEVDEPGHAWSEHQELHVDEGVVRATFHLDDDGRLAVSTNSHERADRILGRLDEVPVTVVSDERTPVEVSSEAPGTGRRPTGLPDLRRLAAPAGDGADGDVAEQIADHLERRWCDEPVPALGGRTPRAAAADPTRREQVVRLIAGFERQPAPPGAITMRPHRLRALLGL